MITSKKIAAILCKYSGPTSYELKRLKGRAQRLGPGLRRGSGAGIQIEEEPRISRVKYIGISRE
jgi:hypothetical protein